MHLCVCLCGYGKYQNPKIYREGILIYGCVCVYAWYSDTLKSYAARRMTYPQTRVYGFLALPFCYRLGTSVCFLLINTSEAQLARANGHISNSDTCFLFEGGTLLKA